MRITLAYPYEGHAPDETIELPDEQARQLIYDGFARLPEDAPADLVADAEAHTQVTTVAPPPAEVTTPGPVQEQPTDEPVAGQPNEENT